MNAFIKSTKSLNPVGFLCSINRYARQTIDQVDINMK